MNFRNLRSRSSRKGLNMDFCIAVTIFGMAFAVSCSGNGKEGKDGNDVAEKIISPEEVDLGLSVKWATCNVGATSPEEYGDYFAWGETQPKSSYNKESSLTYEKSVSELQSAGIINGEGVLTKSHDAAAANWGGTWRMPTKAEFDELCDKCTWTWTQQGGKKGYKVTGPNGNSIFLPAAGVSCGSKRGFEGEYGDYWSSTGGSGAFSAYDLCFNEGSHITDRNGRHDGFSVRPVAE